MRWERKANAFSPVLYEHGRGQGAEVLGGHQLQHHGVGLRVEGARLGGQQPRLRRVAEEVGQQLVVGAHGRVDVLLPQRRRRVARHLTRPAGWGGGGGGEKGQRLGAL